MIGRLSGILIEKQPPFLLIDVQGVGYEVQAPMTSIYPLPSVGQPVVLWTHLSVSETAQQLFAFYTQNERRLFRTLIKVSGVGPKMALAILSGMPVEEFVRCVMEGNTAALVRVPGVGKKTAERLIIEVKDRLKEWGSDAHSTANTTEATFGVNAGRGASQVSADAESALVALGYKPAEAAKMVSQALKAHEGASSEVLIRAALQRLSKV